MADQRPNIPQQPLPKEQQLTPKTKARVTYVPRHDGDPAEVKWNGHIFKANVARDLSNETMIAQARGNPWFSVDGEKAAEIVDHVPRDSDEYRAWAVAWFKKTKSAAEMETHWRDEQSMREKLGVGSDDIDYLMGLYVPRISEMKKAELP